ncbi:MAG TPA: adenylate/guanylate cyclase domain-containing protein [Aestuariivirgaceae bacterium]|nr:adenylate/guanylate cyclase domain-containing protein [Aestuariivirgaceae bacterium]
MPGMKRRLAAILSADVAGYSRLMGADEEDTLRRLTECRKVFFDYIQRHGGRVVNAPGDALLAEFGSVVHAIAAAVEVQRELAERNRGLPEERCMRFRIGINVGDVMVQSDLIYGDGVNIAARLESLAEPGGVCISGSAHDQAEDKLPLRYEDLGEQPVKNIKKPVRAYKILIPGPDAASVTAGARPAPLLKTGEAAPPLADKPSIAILAFDNMSGDPAQDYFSDGISEDIITDLSKLSGLIVIARNSSFAYRGKAVPTRQVAEELGVRYVLEGSVRKSAGRVRITAQLVEAATGQHLWAERYDRDLEEMFALQDAITEEIVTALDVKLVRGEQARLWRKSLRGAPARDCYYQGLDRFWSTSAADLVSARRLFEDVVRLEPESPLGYVQIAWTLWVEIFMGWSVDPPRAVETAGRMVQQALVLDDQNPDAHALHGMFLVLARRHDEAIAAAERAVALGPNSAHVTAWQAAILMLSGQPQQAVAVMERAMRLCPLPPALYGNVLGVSYRDCGQYDRAIEVLKQNIARFPDVITSRFALVTVYNAIGRYDEARDVAREIHAIEPRFSLEDYAKRLPFKDRAVVARILEGLREAGLIASS